jgi:hypothetical protein
MPNRSSIVVWLLLAATISVNLVVYSWMRAASFSSLIFIVYFALLVSQLSVVCIWSAMRSSFRVLRFIAPVAAVFASAGAFGLVRANGAMDILPYFGIHAAMLLAVLWISRRSAYWRRQSGMDTEWQFSIAHLLVLMTVVGVLATAQRYSSLFHEARVVELLLLGGSVALAVASVMIWSRDIHWLLRLAGVLATAIAIGSSFYLVDEYMLKFAVSDYLVQGMMLSAWIGWGQVLPPSAQADVGASAS